MNIGLVQVVAGLLKSLLMAFGLWQVRESGKDAAEKEQLEDELEAVDDARAAKSASRDQRVRAEIDSWRGR